MLGLYLIDIVFTCTRMIPLRTYSDVPSCMRAGCDGGRVTEYVLVCSIDGKLYTKRKKGEMKQILTAIQVVTSGQSLFEMYTRKPRMEVCEVSYLLPPKSPRTSV